MNCFKTALISSCVLKLVVLLCVLFGSAINVYGGSCNFILNGYLPMMENECTYYYQNATESRSIKFSCESSDSGKLYYYENINCKSSGLYDTRQVNMSDFIFDCSSSRSDCGRATVSVDYYVTSDDCTGSIGGYLDYYLRSSVDCFNISGWYIYNGTKAAIATSVSSNDGFSYQRWDNDDCSGDSSYNRTIEPECQNNSYGADIQSARISFDAANNRYSTYFTNLYVTFVLFSVLFSVIFGYM